MSSHTNTRRLEPPREERPATQCVVTTLNQCWDARDGKIHDLFRYTGSQSQASAQLRLARVDHCSPRAAERSSLLIRAGLGWTSEGKPLGGASHSLLEPSHFPVQTPCYHKPQVEVLFPRTVSFTVNESNNHLIDPLMIQH
ncbi:hypothetical protein RRG08_005459 [Elysia crispata]|uniref:Uncharacterized protein n=1 Tax=Elysia crispata TaxID=231223 RepID=A0AAE1CQL4_9GAST|nr:hypothetical protein RRG08_005459 [Elysia crispata]